MRRWLPALLAKWHARLTPARDPRDIESENRTLREVLAVTIEKETQEQRAREYGERVSELMEARMMAGSGPWRVDNRVLAETDKLINFAASQVRNGVNLREDANPITAQGATGDIELALQNVEWRREINLAWLEFSRWGIQQIILISRLHYIKNPWIQRAINIVAAYVFGRGVEVMSEDDDANETLNEFFRRNKGVLGQAALSDLQKRLQYDGQVFFIFFADKQDKGNVTVRTIDATEIFEIETSPDDTDQPWFYHRKWTQKIFDPKTGSHQMDTREAYYPAFNWVPESGMSKVDTIKGKPVMWDTPVLHHKGGTGVAKWHFDCPKAYAALDWAKAGRKWLEACATVRVALAQFAMTLTTKGGQQALEGAKQQLQTTVGPISNLWDKNPPAVAGGIFASGPGTTLSAFKTRGAGGDPKDVAEYRSMVAAVFEIPPTFLGDLETANLATATTLDRPTELAMLEKQERWREVLVTIATYVLNVSQGAASGRLVEKKDCRVVECSRVTLRNGKRVYTPKRFREAAGQPKNDIIVKVNFPSIREGDMPQLVTAIATAMTLGSKMGTVTGIDERAGVGMLYQVLGIEDYGEILDEQYPETGADKYDPLRTKDKEEPEPPAVVPGVPAAPPVKAAERLLRAVRALKEGQPLQRGVASRSECLAAADGGADISG